MRRPVLARRLTIAETVRAYEEGVREVKAAHALLDAASARLNETFVMAGSGGITISGDNRERIFNEIRRDAWRLLIDRCEVRRMMSVARRTELDRQLDRGELPEITEQSVAELIGGFQQNLVKMLEEAVEEVFDWLRPRSSEYKTNSELEVGRKVVLKHVVEPWNPRSCWAWYIHPRRDAELTALENVFSALDGKGQILKTPWCALTTAVRTQGFDGCGTSTYYDFRVFKNGNAHLTFKRLDLLARFNAIAGGRRLRPGAASSES